MAHTGLHAGETAADAIDGLRLELEQCRLELGASRKRMVTLEKAEALLTGENRLLEMIASGCPLAEVLTALCRLIEELSRGCMCGIVLVDPTGTRLEHGAAPSLPPSYNESIHGRPVNADSGPCATAACLGEQVIAADVATDNRWAPYAWCPLALTHGLRSCWSTPIMAATGSVLGTFAIYWREPRSPTDGDQKLIEQTTHLAAVAIERSRTESALRASENYLTEAIDTIPGLVWSVRPDGEVDFLNQRWREYTGLTLERARGWGWSEAIHPDDLARLETYWRSMLASGRPGEIEARLRRVDGTFRWFLFRAVPLYDDAGKLVKWYGQNTDIDDRKRAEALLAGEKRMLEMVARGDALPTVLDALCRLVEAVASDSLAVILLLDSDDNRLWHAASPSLPASYTEGMDGIAIGPSVGSCGTAAYRREPVIVCDIATDPLWAEYRNVALAHGLRASWSTPIFSSTGELLGTFAILSRTARSPTPQHHYLTEQITHLASIAIDRQRAEERLRQSEAYLREAQRLSLTGSFGLKVATGELVWSDETFCIMGYDRTTTPTLELVLNRVHPDDLSAVRETIERATRDQADSDFEHRLLMPDGRIKYVHVMARAAKTEREEIEFVGAVMDITERKNAAEALRASEHLARGQLEALASSLGALSRESVPEKFLEHVLRMAAEQLDAVGVTIWEVSEQSGCVELAANFQDRVLLLPTKNGGSPSLRLKHATADHPVWTEFFRAGKHCVYGAIQNGPPWSQVAIYPDGPWYDWQVGMLDNSIIPQMIKDIAASGIVATLNVPMLVADKVAGLFVLCFKQRRPFRQDEIELTRAMANQAMLAIKLMRLSQANRESAVIAERNRMARDIHDTLAQGFTGVIVQLEAAGDATSKGLTKEAEEHVDRAGDLARESLREARRSVQALRPQALEEKALCEALDALFQKVTEGTSLRCEFTLQGAPRPLPPEWDENLMRIGQEAMTNSLRHAHASTFEARLTFSPQTFSMELRDNGCGFDPTGKHDGFGLLGMRERVEGMGGQLTIQTADGAGTSILIALPLTDRPLDSTT